MSNNNLLFVENNDELKSIIAANPYVLVDFYTDWCGPCKALAPELEKVSKMHDDVQIVKINIDKAKTLSDVYNISSIPTLIYFKDGQEINKTFGYAPASELTNHLKNLKGSK